MDIPRFPTEPGSRSARRTKARARPDSAIFICRALGTGARTADKTDAFVGERYWAVMSIVKAYDPTACKR